MAQRQGYVVSAVGTVLGGVGFLVLGRRLGEEYADRFMPNAELEVLLPMIIGAWGGYWIGTVVGTWVALRVRSYAARAATAALVGLLAPLPVAVLIAVESGYTAEGYSVLPETAAGLLALAGIGPAARAMALRFSRGNGVRSKQRAATEPGS